MYRVSSVGTAVDLKRTAENLERILDTTLAGILLLDDDGTVLFANKALGEFLGADHLKMEGRPFAEFLPPEETDLLAEMHRQAIQGPSEEFRVAGIERKRAGQWIEVFFRRPPGEGNPTYCYFRNISARARVESELRERHAFLNGLIESSVDGIIAADMEGNIVLFNRGAQELLGYTEREAIMELHTTRLYVEGTAYDIMRRMRSDDYGGKGKCFKHRVIALNKHGEEIPLSLSGGIIYNKDGEETATFGIFTDLRRREEMERRLQQQRLELVQSEKMAAIGKLAAGVAHEINNPLSGVLIFANLILEELPADSAYRADLERIISETTRCKGIVRELLDFARQDESTCETADINRIIDSGIHLIRNQAIFRNVTIDLDLAPNLPPARASASRLNQVILNLAINAAEAMDGAGRLTIVSRYLPDESKVRVTVTDTGHGIPPEIRSQIFNPFFTTKEVGKGTGLGLSVSYRIIQDCGGTIDVESEPGRGTTFTIDFIAHRPEGEANQAEAT